MTTLNIGWLARILGICALLVLAACGREQPKMPVPLDDGEAVASTVPDWSRDVVWYQVFPERFRNGDSSNDPTRSSLEFPDIVPPGWEPTSWTGDWYNRADWEREMGDDFYEDGVFHRRLGGDIQGIIDKLDYIADLGITGIYFNPVFYARSLHKYDGNSFHHVDPYFGPDPEADLALMATETSDPETWHWTEADRLFLDLVDGAHKRNIRIVIDGVFNHTGRGFFAFDDLIKNQAASPYVDWYIVQAFDDPATDENEFRYKGWWDVDTLPEFANNAAGDDLHPGPKDYVLKASLRWMDPDGDGNPSDGIDGWRLDVAEEVPIGFWSDWNRDIREVNPDVYTVTEIWNDASAFLAAGGFSATMNYFGFALPAKGYLIDRLVEPSEFADLLVARQQIYPDLYRFSHQNCIESHDTDRLASMIVNKADSFKNPERFDYDEFGTVSPRHSETYAVRAPNVEERQSQRLVALFQYTFVGAPVLYYGTEAGMWGADDPDDRKPMVWSDLTYEAEASDPRGLERPVDEVAFDQSLFSFYKSLAALRHNRVALRRGDFTVESTDDGSGSFSFIRSVERESLWIVLNPGDKKTNFALPEGVDSAEILLSSSGSVEFSQPAGESGERIVVPARSGAVVALLP